MQPVLDYFHVAFGQIAEAGLHVVDDGAGDGVRDRLGGQHVEEPGHRVADLMVEALQGFVQHQAAGAVDSVELRRQAIHRGHRRRQQDGLAITIEVFAYGQHPMVAEACRITGAA